MSSFKQFSFVLVLAMGTAAAGCATTSKGDGTGDGSGSGSGSGGGEGSGSGSGSGSAQLDASGKYSMQSSYDLSTNMPGTVGTVVNQFIAATDDADDPTKWVL